METTRMFGRKIPKPSGKKTIRECVIKALEARGYEYRPNARSNRYYEMALPSLAGSKCRPVFVRNDNGVVPDHKILIGQRGAVRHTKTTIADSVPFTDTFIYKLACEGEKLL